MASLPPGYAWIQIVLFRCSQCTLGRKKYACGTPVQKGMQGCIKNLLHIKMDFQTRGMDPCESTN